MARDFWAEFSAMAAGVYKPDITVGEYREIRGHWLDRLPAIDKDVAFMVNLLEQTPQNTDLIDERVSLAIKEATGSPVRTTASVIHYQPEGYKAGIPINIQISLDSKPSIVLIHFRHVNHAERFETSEMMFTGTFYQTVIPAVYTDSEYPIQYYFEMKEGSDKAWLYPGFNPDLTNQPYFIIRRN